jgi:hypothetical protein
VLLATVLRCRDLAGGLIQSVGEGFGEDAVVFFFVTALDGGEGLQQKLADVGESESVLAIDAAKGELGDEVAEKTLNMLGGGKLTHGAEEKAGAGGEFSTLALEIFAGMEWAERRVGVEGEHVAAMSGLGSVDAAGRDFGKFGRDGGGVLREGGGTPGVFCRSF